MSRPLTELMTVLDQLAGEYTQLLALMETQHAAMKSFDLPRITEMVNQQETIRLRISGLETRRKALLRQLTATLKLPAEPTLARLAELFEPQAQALLTLRERLRDVMGRVAQRTRMSARLSGAVLGHLNTAVRLLARAVARAGLYTRSGTPQVAGRIGVLEAVG